MTKAATRGRGRPGGVSSRRARLLDVAAQQIAGQRSARLNLRELTRAADATPALLHYYFGSLEGLLSVLMQERAEPLLRPLRDELQSCPGGAAATLARFLQKWTSVMARQPWLLCCLLRPTGTATRHSLATLLRDVVAQAQRDGSVRHDLPADYISLLLLMLGTLPQHCGSELGAGLDVPAGASTQLTLLHLAVLQQGIAALS